MAAEPLVSVVVPVFNGATYLDECLESILRQTYTNWDCTIVDNASTDATPEIARRFAARDSRFRHQRFDDFVSAIANHNRAFELIPADSEFCKVVQADDWLYAELPQADGRSHVESSNCRSRQRVPAVGASRSSSRAFV